MEPMILNLENWINWLAFQQRFKALRSAIVKEIDGKYIVAPRTPSTRRIMFNTKHSWMSTDERREDYFIMPEAAARTAMELAAELDNHRDGSSPIQLVSIDSIGVDINSKTYLPMLQFYFEYNEKRA